jgi:2-keto-myo-inositol isomerase
MRHRFGFNGASTGPADLLTDLRAAREANYDALEIRETKLKAYLEAQGSLPALRERLVGAGLEAISLNTIEDSTLRTDMGQKIVLEKCRILCDVAAALACPFVVAVPSPLRRTDPAQVSAKTVEALRAMVALAKPYGVRIGFEFLGFADSSVNTLKAAREIVEAVNDPTVGLVIDAFHFYVGGSTWEMLDQLDPTRLFLVHLDDAEKNVPQEQLTDAHRVLPGDGVIPLRDLVHRVHALGYNGVYSIELFRPEYWKWDPAHLARVALYKMEALFVGLDAGGGTSSVGSGV